MLFKSRRLSHRTKCHGQTNGGGGTNVCDAMDRNDGSDERGTHTNNDVKSFVKAIPIIRGFVARCAVGTWTG